jgi:alpha-tubulin suppressor-like RCC1 family protein
MAFQLANISDADQHCLAVSAQGELLAWGCGQNGELGCASTMSVMHVPRLIESMAHVKIADIAAGKGFSLALSRDGDLYGWGRGACNGLGKDTLTPKMVRQRKRDIQQY